MIDQQCFSDLHLMNTITRDDLSCQEKQDKIFLLAKQAGIMEDIVSGGQLKAEGKGQNTHQLHSTEHEELVPKLEDFGFNGNVEMVEEFELDDVLQCDVSSATRCHTSYITNYESQQVEECEENFKKNCFINYEKIAFNETVAVCRTPKVKDCDVEGPEICRTEHETICKTKQEDHEVEEDAVECKTVEEKNARMKHLDIKPNQNVSNCTEKFAVCQKSQTRSTSPWLCSSWLWVQSKT